MKLEDCEQVAQIEKEAFADPWSEKSLKDFLEKDYAHFFVATDKDAIIGYIGSYITIDEMDITNVAVLEAYRGKGAGNSLLLAVIECGRREGCVGINLEVRESNATAIGLYEKNGFVSLGKRKNFYSHPTENAIIYRYEI